MRMLQAQNAHARWRTNAHGRYTQYMRRENYVTIHQLLDGCTRRNCDWQCTHTNTVWKINKLRNTRTHTVYRKQSHLRTVHVCAYEVAFSVFRSSLASPVVLRCRAGDKFLFVVRVSPPRKENVRINKQNNRREKNGTVVRRAYSGSVYFVSLIVYLITVTKGKWPKWCWVVKNYKIYKLGMCLAKWSDVQWWCL